MIKVEGFNKPTSGDIMVALFATTKAEAETVPGAAIEGLPADFVISPGSTVRTADWEIGTIDENNVWHWA